MNTAVTDEPLIKVDRLSKVFCRNLKKSLLYGLRDSVTDLLSWKQAAHHRTLEHDGAPALRDGEFHAVRNISFELRRGECLGLIGHNGAGKTTLLKMLNGLIKPDAGRIEMRGRVGALIALGAGFNPVLSGRENIYVNGSILGFSRAEIESKIDEIVDFSELAEFIDSPVQTYSSGMQVRLGFAVATAMEPDILLADEVLAVGDINFRVKCYNRIRDILPRTAVILVSHSMFDIVKTCGSVLVAHKGAISYLGPVEGGIDEYNRLNAGNANPQTGLELTKEPFLSDVALVKNDLVQLIKGWVLTLALDVVSSKMMAEIFWRVVFFDASDIPIAEWQSIEYEEQFAVNEGMNHYELKIRELRLVAGRYRVVVVMTDRETMGYYLRIDQGIQVVLGGKGAGGASYRI